MRHNLIIFVGDHLRQICEKAYEYVSYGNDKALPYMHVYNLCPNTVAEGGIKAEHYIPDAPRDAETINTGFKTEHKDISNTEVAIRDFIDEIFRKNVTLETTTDSAKMTLTLIVGDRDIDFKLCKDIIKCAEESANAFRADTLVLSQSICRDVLHIDDSAEKRPTKDVLADLVSIKGANHTLRHIVCIDEYNANGVSINFSVQSLGYMLGEYCMLTTDHYREIYPQASDLQNDRPINALGMSVLGFNTDYFIKYLRRKTLLKVMDKEGVGTQSIDINAASIEAQKYLKSQSEKLKAFWDQHVNPQELSGVSHDEIAASSAADQDAMFETMRSDLDKIIENPQWSLPFKQAVLAQILSEDDDTLKGNIFNTDQLIIEDMTNDALNFFISEDNRTKYYYKRLREEEEKKEASERVYIPDLSALDKPTDQDGTLYNPLSEIKKLRFDIKTSMDFIRNSESQIERLSKQLRDIEQGEKRVTEEGFIYGGVTYHLSEIVDKPLKETYKAAPNKDSQIDLRGGFTPVKAQGNLGSCTAFAVTSVFEYIVKTASGVDTNLSELFLYYNTRAINGKENEDCGSSVYDAITTLSKEGICTETLVPYVIDNFAQRPSDEAYADAVQRRVLEAKNVERNTTDIRSALAEGYPVVISLRVTDDFGKSRAKGFVSMPTDKEIDAIKGSHAMVICGYSDADKFFIVRNSWGPEFGDGGYCYIPYRYIGDTRLLNAAYILTSTTVDTRQVVIKRSKSVTFNSTDANINIAILQNLIGEEEARLAYLNKKYTNEMMGMSHLMAKLQNGAIKNRIRENTVDIANDEISKLEADEQVSRSERQRELNALRLRSFRVVGWTLLVVAAFGVFAYVFFEYIDNNLKAYSIAACAATVIYAIAFFAWYKNGKNAIRRFYDERLDYLSELKHQKSQKAHLMALHTHVYGQFINNFVDYQQYVSETYHKLKSYNKNLADWKERMMLKVNEMHPDEEIPFVPILDNDRLDRYFDENEAYLTDDVWLYPLLKDYKLDNKSLTGLKDNLNHWVEDALRKKIEGFSMVEFVLNPNTYPYLTPEAVSERISLMENRALPFVRYKAALGNMGLPSNVFFANIAPSLRTSLIENLNTYCKNRPIAENINTPYKLILIRNKNISLSEIS